MSRGIVPALAALVLAGAARAEEPKAPEVTLALAWVKDAVVKVEQKLDLENTNRGAATFAGGAGRAEMIVKGHVAVTEEWTDKVVDVTGGRPTEVQRTFKTAKVRAQKSPAAATSLQGVSLAITPAEKGNEVRVLKGKPKELAKKVLGAAPIDPVELLLPKKPVAVGGGWEISVEALQAFQCAICAGCAGVDGSAANDIGVLLQQLERGSVAAVGKIINAKLVSVAEGVATVTFQDDRTHDTDGPIKGPLFDVPPTKTYITGMLTFHVASGRPVKLDWSQLYETGDFTPPPSVGGPTVPGFKENWVLSKTWK